MAQGLQYDLREAVLANNSFGPAEIIRFQTAIAEDPLQFTVLKDAVRELQDRGDLTPADSVRLGVCQYLLGNYEGAIETLRAADGGALAHFYIGRALSAQNKFADAIEAYGKAEKAGYHPDDCAVFVAEAKRATDPKSALEVLDNLSGAVEQTAEYLYQRGATIAALRALDESFEGTSEEQIRLFERAIEVDPTHVGGLFGLALENDRYGNDEEALALYQRAARCFPTHLGVLMNLGILYEDRERYDQAQQCYQRVLEYDPTHERARLFRKDAMASGDMFYDEEAQKRQDRMAQQLSIPVTDFELSVRSRNCLQKMGIRTLGDLTRTTEAELLASKNFGETSLVEIREMLSSKGLSLGQFAHDSGAAEPQLDLSNMAPEEQAVLERPISDLNLSVRARKCMVRLGISSIGELIRKTADDLLESKNFGVTSLNEVREKLTQYSLKLRGE